ncbi:sensor domain-containing protein [Mycolicibacterium sp. 3033]|nr:sensor domain-containing protein [Mycolicibacterium aurantiacum]
MVDGHVIRVAAIAAAVLFTATGCTVTEDGAARTGSGPTSAGPPVRSSAAAPSTTPSTRVSAEAPPVTTAELNTLLLKRSELAQIMGDTDMQQTQVFEKSTYANPVTVEPVSCRKVLLPAESRTWSDDTAAVTGNANRGAGGQAANQLVILLNSPTAAQQALDGIETDWRYCPPDEPFSLTGSSLGRQQWQITAGPSSSGEPRQLSVTSTRQDPLRVCSHAFTTKINVLIEAIACGTGDTAVQAATILDGIAAKID